MVLSAPTFIIPGLSMFLFDKFGLIPKARIPKTLFELTVIAVGLTLAPPLSVALFPQKGSISANEIEAEFKEMRNSRGEIVHTYFYNKGL